MATYTLSDKEEVAQKKFSKKHYEKCHAFSIHTTFIPNGIGSSVMVTCPRCKKEKNITDISSW
jgi:hypothetical protein